MNMTLEEHGGGTAASPAENTAAYAAASAALPGNAGIIQLGRGRYRFSRGFKQRSYLTIQGQGGYGSTHIDFSEAEIAEPGIDMDGYGQCLRDIHITGANGPNVRIAGAHQSLKNLEVGANRRKSNIVIEGTYLTSLTDMFVHNGEEHGVENTAFTTSLVVSNVQSGGNKRNGFKLYNVTYSSFKTSTADENNNYAYELCNVAGLSFDGVGAESNGLGMFVATSSAATAVGSQVPGITGVTITSSVSFNNGIRTPHQTAYLETAASGGIPIDITVISPKEITCPNNISVLASGAPNRLIKLGGSFKGSVTMNSGATFRDI